MIQQAEAASTRIGSLKYMECSSMTNEGVKGVFAAATLLTMMPNEKLKKIRSVLRLFGKE